ncbi:hypothetical protein MRX96_044583 [Rhipicephalus microplus]
MIVHLGVANQKRQIIVHRQYRHDTGAKSFQECVDVALGTGGQSCWTWTDVTAIEFLNELYVLIKNFCGTTTEGSLRKNALLIEEILSEIVNRGHIYTTDLSSLRPCIYSEPADTPALKKTVLTSTLLALDTKSVVPNTTALRPVFGSRLEQSQNQQKAEIFVDVVEKGLRFHLQRG